MASKAKKRFLQQDLGIIVISILIALVLLKTKALSSILVSSVEMELIGSFVAGMFFTSVFTTAPAIVTLGEIAQNNSIYLTAFFGALGAVIGDLIIFMFIKDRLGEHLLELVKHDSILKKLKHWFKLKYFRWFTFLVGGLIIASPLPDELGIGLLGFSKIKSSSFILLSFTFNFIGILIIGLVAQAL
ncbi:MAG: hypothetical protein EXS47_01310 [Candidatus Zambryskibacteria bacterium]|nr:hypothetical protein [Candidatus Zambryskibacteria bacterium]